MTKFLITGGCGFIGSNFIFKLLKLKNIKVLNIDNLSKSFLKNNVYNFDKKKYIFKKIDIENHLKIRKIFNEFRPDIVVNFAAESHVDNSINSPLTCINTNILGTYNLLEAARIYLSKNRNNYNKFKFIHISTDEVFGSLKIQSRSSKETDKYFTNSPYSASKASSEHLVRAWNKTYNLPTIITNCTNNFGPFQHTEKLIPLVIKSCLENKEIPIYGDGKNIREWIYVEDHINALMIIIKKGKIGENYNIGSNYKINNINLVKKICKIFNNLYPNFKYENLIKFVKDRPGHDFRYSLNSSKIKRELNYKTKFNFDQSLKKTIKWYINNKKYIL